MQLSTIETPSISERVLDTIADKKGISPMEFDRPIYDVIDPDTLDSLFHSSEVNVQVEFRYLSYDITISRDGDIHLDHPEE